MEMISTTNSEQQPNNRAIETSFPFATVGEPIPGAPHAVSVSLPSWKANVAYEEGEQWVLSKMKSGYPRFFVHPSIRSFAQAIVARYGKSNEEAMLFPTSTIAIRCASFILRQAQQSLTRDNVSESLHGSTVRVLDLFFRDTPDQNIEHSASVLSAVFFLTPFHPIAKKFWQHSGEGISSRRAEYFFSLLRNDELVVKQQIDPIQKGPRRYKRDESLGKFNLEDSGSREGNTLFPDLSRQSSIGYKNFIEERFGRNLDVPSSNKAKLAIRRRIAGLSSSEDLSKGYVQLLDPPPPQQVKSRVEEKDVYLFPTGMSSIFNVHRVLMNTFSPSKSVMFGFPYIDTLKILENFGPGCIFYGHGSEDELNDLEQRCLDGESILALFCEVPGNPLLKTPNLTRIREIADKYRLAVVIDETIGNFLNVDVLPFADVVVSSLTKIFSGDSNVMGGSCLINPRSRFYAKISMTMSSDYEDNYWHEDAIFMERNSRDFVNRNKRINASTESICALLRQSPIVKRVNYPKFSISRSHFEKCKLPSGGYGGLFSVEFNSISQAISFFDALETAKGPSLGTNFTLSSPYVILAHYHELDWSPWLLGSVLMQALFASVWDWKTLNNYIPLLNEPSR